VTDEPPAPSNTEYLLAELRCASLRCRLAQADIEAIGILLKQGFITPEQAVYELRGLIEMRVLGPLAPLMVNLGDGE